MPVLDNASATILGLRAQCRRYHALPRPGGLLDQPARVMALFRVVDERESHWQREQEEEQRRMVEHERLRAKLR